MQTVFDQWQDGLITGEEALCNLLSNSCRIAVSMKETIDSKAWYHLERWSEDHWINEANQLWKPILLTKEEANQINQVCKAGYRWHSTLGHG